MPRRPPCSKIQRRARDERLVVGAHSYAAQRGITLDGAVDVALRRVVIRFPGAVRTLRFQQCRDEIVLARMPVTQEVHGEQPFGFHAVVRLEHSDPEPVGVWSRSSQS